jgi:hypothetical protein
LLKINSRLASGAAHQSLAEVHYIIPNICSDVNWEEKTIREYAFETRRRMPLIAGETHPQAVVILSEAKELFCA